MYPGNHITPAMRTYKSLVGFLYKDCEGDCHGLLVDECENGKCGKWQSNFEVLRQHIEQPKLNNYKGFVRFEYLGEENKLDIVQDPMTPMEIVSYIEKKLDK